MSDESLSEFVDTVFIETLLGLAEEKQYWTSEELLEMAKEVSL